MKTTIVHITVETRPQYGTCDRFLVGIFDDFDKMNAAIKYAEEKYKRFQHSFNEKELVLNENNLKG